MNMKWLFISPEFPPSTKTGGIRPSKFAKYLNRKGQNIVVITNETDGVYSYEPDAGISIERVKRKKIPFINDEGANFLFFNLFSILRKIKVGKYDVVFISVPVFLPMVIGLLGKFLFKQDYCLDYRDLWRADPYPPSTFKDKVLRYIAKYIEPLAMKHAKLITFVSETMLLDQMRKYNISLTNAEVVSTGYDEDDITNLERTNPDNYINKYGSFISHVGMLDPNMNVRDIANLLNDRLVTDLLESKGLKFYFVGAKQGTIHECIPPDIVQKYCVVEGAVSRQEALLINKYSYMSLVLGSNSPQRLNRKVFELIRLSKRIFYIGHPYSETAKVLRFCDEKKIYNSTSDLPRHFVEAIESGSSITINSNIFLFTKERLVANYLNLIYDKFKDN